MLMRRLAILSILALGSLACNSLWGLNIQQGALPNKRLFAVEFPNGLSFYARHDRINSASMQRYQSGPYLVTEMVIDIADSDVLLRVYHTELMTTQRITERTPDEVPGAIRPDVPDAVQKLIDRGRKGTDRLATGDMVVKDYPTSTHAKTVEFRVSQKEELENFYQRFISIFTGQDSPAGDDDANATRITLAGTIFTLQ